MYSMGSNHLEIFDSTHPWTGFFVRSEDFALRYEVEALWDHKLSLCNRMANKS